MTYYVPTYALKNHRNYLITRENLNWRPAFFTNELDSLPEKRYISCNYNQLFTVNKHM